MYTRLCCGSLLVHAMLGAAPAAAGPAPAQVSAPAQADPKTTNRPLTVTTGKSLVVDSPVTIERVSVGNPAVAEAVAVSPREIVINGKDPGETTVIVWQEGGNRLIFDLTVRASTVKIENVRRELQAELAEQKVSIGVE